MKKFSKFVNPTKKVISTSIAGAATAFTSMYTLFHNPVNIDEDANLGLSAATGLATFAVTKTLTDKVLGVEPLKAEASIKVNTSKVNFDELEEDEL